MSASDEPLGIFSVTKIEKGFLVQCAMPPLDKEVEAKYVGDINQVGNVIVAALIERKLSNAN
jgi:hypothetical protein